jgi:hypothetical protein
MWSGCTVMANVIVLCEFHSMSLSPRKLCGKVSVICLCLAWLLVCSFNLNLVSLSGE